MKNNSIPIDAVFPPASPCKRAGLTILALFAGAVSSSYAQLADGETIAIDFGTIAPSGPLTFNQFDAFNNSIANDATLAWSALGINGGVLKNTLNVDVTGVGFTVLNESGQNTSRADVTNGSAGAAPFDVADIYQDSIISNQQSGKNLDAGGYFVFTFTGLDDSLTYDLSGGYDGANGNFNSTWSFDSSSAGISTTQNDGISSFLAATGGSGYHDRTGLKTDGSGNLKIQVTRSNHVNAGSLTLTAVAPSGTTWQTDGNGDWSTPGNWTASVPNAASAVALFSGNLYTGPLTANLDVGVTLGELDFDSTESITISGANTLTFDNGGSTASVEATGGSHLISSAVSLTDPIDLGLDAGAALEISGALSGTTSVTNSGEGQLTLSGDLSGHTGSIISDAGTLVVSGTSASDITANAGSLVVSGTGSSDITVAAGATLSGEGSHSGTLSLAGGNTLSVDPTNGTTAFTAGTLSPAAPVEVGFSSSPFGLGTFTVLNYSSYAGVVATDFVNSEYRISFADTTTSITATVAPAETSNWTGADGVNPTFWDNGTSTNWSSGDNLFYSEDVVTFTDVGTIDPTESPDPETGANVRIVDVQESVAPGTLNFSNTAGNDWWLVDVDADVETIKAETGGINVTGGGNVTMFTKITGNTDINHSGTGILFLGGGGTDNDFVGTITVDGGGELRNIRNPTGAAGGKFNSLGDFGNTITVTNGSTFDAWVRTAGHDFQNYGTGSFIFGDGTTLSNTGTAHGSDLFSDQLVFDGDVTLSGLMRVDIFGTIDVTATDITVTVDFVQPSGNIGTVLGGDNSAQSIALWHIVEGTLFVNGADSLGDNAEVRVEDGGILRGNRGNALGDWITINDIFLEMGAQLQKRDQDNVWNLDGTVTVEGDTEIRPGGFNDVIALNGTLAGAGNLTFNNQGLVRIGTLFDDSGFTGDLIIGDNAGNKTLQLADLDVGVAETATVLTDIIINETGNENFDVEVTGLEDTLTLSGVISGSGAAGLTKTSPGSLILSGQNTYTGNSVIYNGNVTLTSTSRTTIVPTTNGTNNHIDVRNAVGPTVNADGELYFDLSGANTDSGNVWQIITGAGAGNVTTGATFSVNSSLGAFTNNLDGTFSLDDGSNVWVFSLLDGSLSIPIGDPYVVWAGGELFGDDTNGDGVDNGLAWMLGAADVNEDALPLLPTSVESSGALVMSFTIVNPIAPNQLFVEYSTDLTGAWTAEEVPAATGTVGAIDFVITDNGGTLDVVATINAGSGSELFGRLSATEAP